MGLYEYLRSNIGLKDAMNAYCSLGLSIIDLIKLVDAITILLVKVF